MWTSPSPSFDQVMSEFLLHFARFQVGGWKLEADFGKKEKGNIRSSVIKEKAILDWFDLLNRNQGTSGGLGGLSTSQKTYENYWGGLLPISSPWKKYKSGSQILVFLPLKAMFGDPGHGPKISKVSF